jgi:hypothetical protein
MNGALSPWTNPRGASPSCVDDWPRSVARVVSRFKEAPRRRVVDLAAGLDAYRPLGGPAPSPETSPRQAGPIGPLARQAEPEDHCPGGWEVAGKVR